jgi:DNA invertase Pin-like site-specific DNA recombinase
VAHCAKQPIPGISNDGDAEMSLDPKELADLLSELADDCGQQSPRSRRRANKGLPDTKAREELARTYLTVQHRLWPELVESGILPLINKKSVSELAEKFRQRFLSDGSPEIPELRGRSIWKSLGLAYLRYSDLASNPRSLDQQLTNVLTRAASDKVFIPWGCVFADAAVTGTIAARRGYQLAKALIRIEGGTVKVLYIDELGRASRDHIESLHLGRLVVDSGKRIVGATDGFDSEQPNWKWQLTIFAMLHDMFIQQLREKVIRGMRDAFEQGKNIRPPAFGYELVPMKDQDGQILLDDDSRVKTEVVINEEEAKFVRQAFEQYVGSISPMKIAREFNKLTVGGRQAWDNTALRQLLERSTYRGVETNGKTYQVKDPETGKITVKQRPESEWQRRDVPHLRIVSDELWEQAQARLQRVRDAYDPEIKAETRSDVYPKRLLSLWCGYCKKTKLNLGRSGKYASICCLNGRDGKHDCRLKGYKSLQIVEDSILGHLSGDVFTEDFYHQVVDAANSFLAKEAKRPPMDVSPLEARIRQKTQARDRITAALEEAAAGDNLKAVLDRVAEIQEEINDFQRQIDLARAATAPPPPPLALDDVKALAADLPNLLRGEVEQAAPLLKLLTGPIVVTQTQEKGKKKPTWIAQFQVNAVPVMLELAKRKGCPSTQTWEYLNTRSWTNPNEVQVTIGKIPKYEALALKFVALEQSGSSISAIASAYGMSQQYTAEIIRFGKTGEKPKWKCGKRTGRGQTTKTTVYREIGPLVVKLRVEERLTWDQVRERVAKELGRTFSNGTLHRAFDSADREAAKVAVAEGQCVQRGNRRRLSSDVLDRIRTLLSEGKLGPVAIAREVGVNPKTVYAEGKAARLTTC